MPTPDELAASLPDGRTWQGQPVPEIGRAVKMTYSFNQVGRIEQESACGIVTAVQLPRNRHMIVTLGNGKSYLLVENTRDMWVYTDLGDVATVQAVADADETPAQREHHNRLATDEIYRHHWETMSERMALTALRAAQEHDETNPFGPDVSDEVTPTVGDGIPDPHADSLAARMRRLGWLDEQIEACESQLKALKAERTALDGETVQAMAMEGVPAMTVDEHTYFMRTTSFLRVKEDCDSKDVMEALRASGLGHMVKLGYSGNSLKSLLIEYRDSDGQTPVPAALDAVVELTSRTTIGRTRAAAKKRAPRTSAFPGHTPRA